MLDRLLNERPTIYVLVALAVVLSGVDLGTFKETIVSISGLAAWMHVRSQVDGPQTRKRDQ